MRTIGHPNSPKPGDTRYVVFGLEYGFWVFHQIYYAPSRKKAAEQYRNSGMVWNKSQGEFIHRDHNHPTKMIADPQGRFANGDVLPDNWEKMYGLSAGAWTHLLDAQRNVFEQHRETKAAEHRAALQAQQQQRQAKFKASIVAKMSAEHDKVETCQHCGRDIIHIDAGFDNGWYDAEGKWLCASHVDSEGDAADHVPRVLDLPSDETAKGLGENWSKVETDHD